jgi:hypothetical protein
MRPLRTVALAVTAAALVACGSTVQVQGSASAGNDLGTTGGGGLGTSGGAEQPVVPAGGTGGDVPAEGPSAATTGPVVPGMTGTAGGGEVSTSSGTSTFRAAGQGFTQDVVYIGVGTANDFNALAGSLGVEGVSYDGDPRDWLNAVAADVNRHGGLAGRTVVPVAHDYNSAQLLNDPATANEAACADWTQDHHVFAVALAGMIAEDALLQCLAKTGTPLIMPGGGLDYPLHYAESYRRFPLFFNVGQMLGDTFDRIAYRRLKARGFFTPWDTVRGKPGTAANPVKVGFIGFDDHDGDLELASIKRQLARNGVGLSDADVVRCPRSLSTGISCQQSTVLKFASAGVTHVLGAGTTFLTTADRQQYRPRYFIDVEPRLFAANAPANQLVGAMGEGYVPVMDVEPRDVPGDPTPATAYCKEVMKAAGQATDDPTTLWLQYLVCDEFYFLKAAVDAIGGLGSTALRSGFERLGSRQESAVTWGTSFGPTMHASATVLRDIAYRSDLKRFVYTSRVNYGDS